MTASSGTDTRARRAFLWIAAVAVLLAVALTAGWYYLAGRIDTEADRAIAAAARNGTELSCANRAVFGYPFRLGLSCDAVSVEAPGSELRATAGALRTASQIYDPTRIVAELDSPAFLDAGSLPPLDLRWALAQGSGRIWFGGAQQVSMAFSEPVISLSQPAGDRLPLVQASRFEAHARERDGALDVAFRDEGVAILAPDLPELPVFDASGDVTLDGAGEWLAGGFPQGTARDILAGRTGTLRSLLIDVGEADAELSGAFRFEASGALTGDFELAVAAPEEVASLVEAVLPEFGALAGSVASAVSFLGRRENGRSVIPLTVRAGAISAGILPLGSIPPLR